jgi:hypothetical protein
MRSGLFAFAIACAFLGAALYINVVEQPSRLALHARAMLQEWMLSNRRGFVMLAVLAVASAVLALLDFGRSGDVRWLIGGAVILSTWPYAYFVVVPVNFMLYFAPAARESSTLRELMRDWGLVEWGQTAIAFAACVILGWAIALPA